MGCFLWLIGILACIAGYALRGPWTVVCVVILSAAIAWALIAWTGREERKLERDRKEILREIEGRK